MFRVTMHFAGKPVRAFTFEKSLVTIGRDSTCDIVVDNIGTSRRHAMIEHTQDGYVLADLRSNNGTFVHGERVLHHRLDNADEFLIGKYAFRLEDLGVAAAQSTEPVFPDAPDEQTVHLDRRELDKLRARSVRKTRVELVQMAPTKGRRTIALGDTYHVLGRDPHAAIRVRGLLVPRHAAVFVRTETGYDLVATSRTVRVNGRRLPATPLADGDLIQCGRARFRYCRA